MSRQQRHRNKNIKLKKAIPLIVIILLFPAIFSVFAKFDKQLTDTAIKISHTESKLAANKMIDQAVTKTIAALGLESSDLFVSRQSAPEAISANTLLINEFCALVSEDIVDNLSAISEVSIPVPLGQLSGVDILANLGPSIPFSLRPVGTVNVDYETSFTAVGINQINFKIWINVDIGVDVVYPLHQEPVALSRKIMLVDTVISGTVPEQYLNFQP